MIYVPVYLCTHKHEHTGKYGHNVYYWTHTYFVVIILQIIEIKNYLHNIDITLGIINSLEILQSI